MAKPRNRQHSRFNFLVDLGSGKAEAPQAGFQKVSGIELDVKGSNYRAQKAKKSSVRKITGLNKTTDVTLKRGVIGAASLQQWLDEIRSGQVAERTITISLQNEDHTGVVQTWKLLRARIITHTIGPMNAKGTDVALEELVISFERLEKE